MENARKIRLGHLPSKHYASALHTKSPKLKYNGGPLLCNVEIFTTFWGAAWQNQPALTTLMGGINNFFNFIVTSPLIDQLAEYSVPGKTIGHGKYLGSKVVTDSEPGALIADAAIQTTLQNWIKTDPAFPQVNANSLYFIYFPPGTTVTLQADKSCQTFGGYHDHINSTIFYAVEPFCTSDTAGLSQQDFFTLTSSHELCESITDPVPGGGWYWLKDQQHQGEIGDICEAAANAAEKMGDFVVQREWSNHLNRCA